MTTTFTRDEIKQLLTEGVYNVEFTKVNGEHRVMPCTLSAALLPIIPVKVVAEGKEVKERKESLDTLRVFCTDKNEWRSFRIDSVISVTAI